MNSKRNLNCDYCSSMEQVSTNMAKFFANTREEGKLGREQARYSLEFYLALTDSLYQSYCALAINLGFLGTSTILYTKCTKLQTAISPNHQLPKLQLNPLCQAYSDLLQKGWIP